jgi:hypothetical protein
MNETATPGLERRDARRRSSSASSASNALRSKNEGGRDTDKRARANISLEGTSFLSHLRVSLFPLDARMADADALRLSTANLTGPVVFLESVEAVGRGVRVRHADAQVANES